MRGEENGSKKEKKIYRGEGSLNSCQFLSKKMTHNNLTVDIPLEEVGKDLGDEEFEKTISEMIELAGFGKYQVSFHSCFLSFIFQSYP
jgi:hypothetical protein